MSRRAYQTARIVWAAKPPIAWRWRRLACPGPSTTGSPPRPWSGPPAIGEWVWRQPKPNSTESRPASTRIRAGWGSPRPPCCRWRSPYRARTSLVHARTIGIATRSSRVACVGSGLLGDNDPQGDIEDHARAAEDGEDDEQDPDQGGVEVEVFGQATTHPGQLAVARAAVQLAACVHGTASLERPCIEDHDGERTRCRDRGEPPGAWSRGGRAMYLIRRTGGCARRFGSREPLSDRQRRRQAPHPPLVQRDRQSGVRDQNEEYQTKRKSLRCGAPSSKSYALASSTSIVGGRRPTST